MSFSQVLAIGTGVVIGSVIGRFSGIIAIKSEIVNQQHKGSHIHRMYEVARAHFTQKYMQDDYTAQNHIETVMTLSLRSEGEDDAEKKRVIRDLNQDFMGDAHYHGHLYKNPTFVFEYITGQKVPMPINPSTNNEGFIYAGTASTLHHTQSRHDILSGNYIRCKSVAIHEKSLGKYHKVDVIITGSTDRQMEEKIKKAILVEAAMQASLRIKDKADRNNPYSDTVVIECIDNNCKEVGDLTSIPDSVKSKITKREFVACPDISFRRSLFNKKYEQHSGAIVVIKTDDNDDTVCRDLKSAQFIAQLNHCMYNSYDKG